MDQLNPPYFQQIEQEIRQIGEKRRQLPSIPLHPQAEGWDVLKEETALQIRLAEMGRLFALLQNLFPEIDLSQVSPEALRELASEQDKANKAFLDFVAASFSGAKKEAFSSLQLACQNSQEPRFHIELNRMLIAQGQYQSGQDRLFALLEAYPELPERGWILQEIFRSRFENGDLRGAWDALAEAQGLLLQKKEDTALQIPFIENQVSFARLYAKAGSKGDAESLANQVLVLHHALAPEKRKKADIFCAEAYNILGDLATGVKNMPVARDCFEKAIKLSKDRALLGNAEAKIQQAYAHYGVGNTFFVNRNFEICFPSFEQALLLLEEASQLDPLAALPITGTWFINLGSFYNNLEDRVKMHDNYLRGAICRARLYTVDPQANFSGLIEALSFLYQVEMLVDNYPGALAYLDSSLKLFEAAGQEQGPDLAESHRYCGICHRELENWDLSLQHLMIAEQLYEPLSKEQANPYLLYYCKTFLSQSKTYAAAYHKNQDETDKEKAQETGQKALRIAKMQNTEPAFQEELQNIMEALGSLD